MGALYIEAKKLCRRITRRLTFWLTLATKQNFRNAERQRNSELLKKLTKDDITKLEVSAAAWKSKAP